MPLVSSPLGTTQPYIPAVAAAELPKFAGLHMHFATLAALVTAVGTVSPAAGERGNIQGGTPVWENGQPFTCGDEPPSVHRVWLKGADAASSHARTVVLPNGKSVVLAGDAGRVISTAGAPASGVGTNGDIAIDVAAGSYYLKAAGAWGAAIQIFTAAAGAGAAAAVVIAASGASQTVDMANYGLADITLTSNCALALSGAAAAGTVSKVELIVRQDGNGGHVFSFPAGTKWPGGLAPTVSAAAYAYDRFLLESLDGGAIWYGSILGQGYSDVTYVGLDAFNRADSATSLGNADTGGADRKSTRLNSSHTDISRMPSSA